MIGLLFRRDRHTRIQGGSVSSFHPDYGLPHTLRLRAVKDAHDHGVSVSATKHNVSPSSIYRWRKRIPLADLHRLSSPMGTIARGS